jgi:hypothetical protein
MISIIAVMISIIAVEFDNHHQTKFIDIVDSLFSFRQFGLICCPPSLVGSLRTALQDESMSPRERQQMLSALASSAHALGPPLSPFAAAFSPTPMTTPAAAATAPLQSPQAPEEGGSKDEVTGCPPALRFFSEVAQNMLGK